jgi:hypothetical protein
MSRSVCGQTYVPPTSVQLHPTSWASVASQVTPSGLSVQSTKCSL